MTTIQDIPLKPLHTERDYHVALAHLDALQAELTERELSEREYEVMEVLAILVERYEMQHYPVPMPTPQQAVQARMEDLGLQQKDIAPIFGAASRVSEFLAGKRQLSATVIAKLHQALHLPYAVLMPKVDAPFS